MPTPHGRARGLAQMTQISAVPHPGAPIRPYYGTLCSQKMTTGRALTSRSRVRVAGRRTGPMDLSHHHEPLTVPQATKTDSNAGSSRASHRTARPAAALAQAGRPGRRHTA